MNINKWIAVTAVAVVAAAACAEEGSKWEISASLDVYALQSSNRPFNNELGIGRAYDVFDRNPSIAEFGIDLHKPAGNGCPFGLTLDLFAGNNAIIDNFFEPGGDRYQPFKQAFISWDTPSEKAGVKLGKFSAPIGYESRTASQNSNYGRSMSFANLEPVYFFGLMGWMNFNDSFSGGAYVVNGWNEVKDSNDKKSFGGYVEYKKPNYSVRVNGYSGKEGGDRPSGFYGFSDETDVDLFEGVATYNVNDKMALGLDLNQLSVDTGTSYKLKGAALYATYKCCPTWSVGARYEEVTDDGFFDFNGHNKFKGTTLTFDKDIDGGGKLRIEYRTDKANLNSYPNQVGFSDERNSWSVSYQIKIK